MRFSEMRQLRKVSIIPEGARLAISCHTNHQRNPGITLRKGSHQSRCVKWHGFEARLPHYQTTYTEAVAVLVMAIIHTVFLRQSLASAMKDLMLPRYQLDGTLVVRVKGEFFSSSDFIFLFVCTVQPQR